jgi:hypothetical protein
MQIQSFDSYEDMLAAMFDAEAVANAGLTPGQVRLRDDVENVRCWAYPIPHLDVVLYGKTPRIADVQTEDGFNVAENRARGYLTGTVFSAVEPDGEFGDTHVSQVVPITLHAFTLAEAFGWPTYQGLREGDNQILNAELALAEVAARK